MANPEHVAILAKGVGAWNAWRVATEDDVIHDLNGVVLSPSTSLGGIDFDDTSLCEAFLPAVTLRWATLRRANLRGARLPHADLDGTTLYAADLREADLKGARIQSADLSWANLECAISKGRSCNDLI